MSQRRSLVQNAGSEKQVRRAERTERDREERFRDGLLATLSSPRGRAFIYGLLEQAGCWRSVWAEHGQRMAFNVGQQDFGHWLMAECLETDETLFQQMEREGRAWKRHEDKTAAAGATADEGEQDA